MQVILDLQQSSTSNTTTIERGIAVAVVRKGIRRYEIDEQLDEIEQLCRTAGADIVLRVIQERSRLDPATFIGKGKVEELRSLIEEYRVQFVIFDDNLSPVQVRNLQRMLEVKIIDRSMLILDIFAQHARTLEAKTQVELAQLEYLYPRLTRLWTHLSRQYGGIGTKGPGETQIETDRRLIKERISHLRYRLTQIEQQRSLQRKERQGLFRFALVGYTNAGKSTLFNVLTKSQIAVEDKLFATLDTTVRRFYLPSGIEALMSDTVGFIRNLPPQLVASFHSTLAEAVESDVLIHVADASHPALTEHIKTVEETLATLEIETKPRILVLNKVDRLTEPWQHIGLQQQFPTAVFISAQTRYNIGELLSTMECFVLNTCIRITAHLPYSAMKELSYIYDNSIIMHRIERDDGIVLEFLIPAHRAQIARHVLDGFIQSVKPQLSVPR